MSISVFQVSLFNVEQQVATTPSLNSQNPFARKTYFRAAVPPFLVPFLPVRGDHQSRLGLLDESMQQMKMLAQASVRHVQCICVESDQPGSANARRDIVASRKKHKV